jgi:hypothetical protein
MEILVMANFSRFLLLFLYECRPSDWWYNSDGIPFARACLVFPSNCVNKNF